MPPTLDLSKMLKPKSQDLGSQLSNPDSKSENTVTDNAQKEEIASGQKYYLYSIRPDLRVPLEKNAYVKFKGNYLTTTSVEVKNYLLEHYSKYVSEITSDMFTDAHTFRQE